MKYKLLIITIIFYGFWCPIYSQKLSLDSLLNVLKTQKEDTSKVNLYRNICGTMRFTDPIKAIEYGKKGIELSKKLGFDKGSAGNYLNTATAFTYADKLDSALYYLNIAIQYSLKVGDPNRLGLAYLNRADTYRQLVDFNKSLKDCSTALKYADKANNDDVKARINQTIGSIYFHQNLYPKAINYYNKAILLYSKINNQRMTAVVYNNLGLIHKNNKDYPKAIEVTKKAIQILDSLKDITNLSIFNGNLSDAYYQKKDYAQSEKYINKAMEYAQIQKNEKLIADAWLLAGSTYNKQRRYVEALTVLNKALPVFKKMDYTEKIDIAADLLAEVYANTGNYEKAYENVLESRMAKDSLLKWQYDDDLAAMETKFNVDEKDKEILLLAKDKELQTQKLNRQRLLIWGTSVLALLALAGIWLAINRYKLRQTVNELEIRNQIAADLHDEVGSSLSSIQMLSQMINSQPHTDEKDRAILQKVSNNATETMEKMSDIVWMIKPGENDAAGLADRMQRFLYEMAESKNILSNFTTNNLGALQLTMSQRKNIYLIFKEAVNNAMKYSGTTSIAVSLEFIEKQLILTIQDLGKGFNKIQIRRGNGLENMQNRAKELNANFELNSEIDKGTAIKLCVSV